MVELSAGIALMEAAYRMGHECHGVFKCSKDNAQSWAGRLGAHVKPWFPPSHYALLRGSCSALLAQTLCCGTDFYPKNPTTPGAEFVLEVLKRDVGGTELYLSLIHI